MNLEAWVAWARPIAFGILALDGPGFDQVLQRPLGEFAERVRGAILRHQLLEDLFGHLRLSVLNAAGVTFQKSPKPRHLKPGELAPTFELLMGRASVDVLGREVAPEAKEPQELSPKAQRGMAMIAAASHRRKVKGPVAPAPAPAPPVLLAEAPTLDEGAE